MTGPTPNIVVSLVDFRFDGRGMVAVQIDDSFENRQVMVADVRAWCDEREIKLSYFSGYKPDFPEAAILDSPADLKGTTYVLGVTPDQAFEFKMRFI